MDNNDVNQELISRQVILRPNVKGTEYDIAPISLGGRGHCMQLIGAVLAPQGGFQQFNLLYFAEYIENLFTCYCSDPLFKVLRGFSPRYDIHVNTFAIISEPPKTLSGRVGKQANETTPKFHESDYCPFLGWQAIRSHLFGNPVTQD